MPQSVICTTSWEAHEQPTAYDKRLVWPPMLTLRAHHGVLQLTTSSQHQRTGCAAHLDGEGMLLLFSTVALFDDVPRYQAPTCGTGEE